MTGNQSDSYAARECREDRDEELLIVGKLAEAYQMLAMAPYDNWGHRGSPGEMAAYVVTTAKRNGNLGSLRQAVLGDVMSG